MRPHREADSSSFSQQTSSHFTQSEGLLTRSDQPVTCPYPEPDQSSPRPPNQLLYDTS